MGSLDKLLQNNAAWSEAQRQREPEFFSKLCQQQSPEYLWIGCSDSRVPANQIVGLLPGEVFVHRNVANLVVHTDFNCLSVLQFAVEVLKVKHILVCGHYGCGGISAAMENRQMGLIDNWLRHVRDIYERHRNVVEQMVDPAGRLDKLCELNVVQQVLNVCHTTIVQNAWSRGQELNVHGLIYRLQDGILKVLHKGISSPAGLSQSYRLA